MNTVQANTGNCFNNSDFKRKYNNQLKQRIHIMFGRVDMRVKINIIIINYEEFVDNLNVYLYHFRAVTYKTKLMGLSLLCADVILPRLCFTAHHDLMQNSTRAYETVNYALDSLSHVSYVLRTTKNSISEFVLNFRCNEGMCCNPTWH
jgi:hypothetical protein